MSHQILISMRMIISWPSTAKFYDKWSQLPAPFPPNCT